MRHDMVRPGECHIIWNKQCGVNREQENQPDPQGFERTVMGYCEPVSLIELIKVLIRRSTSFFSTLPSAFGDSIKDLCEISDVEDSLLDWLVGSSS